MAITFRVPDMTCGHCASTIARAVRAEDATARLEFDMGQHLVRISSPSSNEAELRSAIGTAGYTALAVQESVDAAPAGGCGCGCGPTTAQQVDLPQSASPAKRGCCS